ncbi:unnamed protein product [Ixodes persulcatus]
MAKEQLCNNARASTNNAFPKHMERATCGIAFQAVNAAREIQSTRTATAHQTIKGGGTACRQPKFPQRENCESVVQTAARVCEHLQGIPIVFRGQTNIINKSADRTSLLQTPPGSDRATLDGNMRTYWMAFRVRSQGAQEFHEVTQSTLSTVKRT